MSVVFFDRLDYEYKLENRFIIGFQKKGVASAGHPLKSGR